MATLHRLYDEVFVFTIGFSHLPFDAVAMDSTLEVSLGNTHHNLYGNTLDNVLCRQSHSPQGERRSGMAFGAGEELLYEFLTAEPLFLGEGEWHHHQEATFLVIFLTAFVVAFWAVVVFLAGATFAVVAFLGVAVFLAVEVFLVVDAFLAAVVDAFLPLRQGLS